MTVHVKLLGDFGENLDRSHCLSIQGSVTINTIIRELGVENAGSAIVLVNGSGCNNRDAALNDGDTVTFLPFIDGG